MNKKMPISLDDQARLPAMVLPEKVVERQRQEDLRNYRQYLVDSGSIRALVKLYKHIAKNELRMDNPALLKEFLGAYRDGSPEQAEIERLVEENVVLKQNNEELEQKMEELKRVMNATGSKQHARCGSA